MQNLELKKKVFYVVGVFPGWKHRRDFQDVKGVFVSASPLADLTVKLQPSRSFTC